MWKYVPNARKIMSEVIKELVEEIQSKYNLLNPSQVADAMDLDRSHLRKMIKRDGNPDAVNYLKLAKKAGWDIDKAQSRIEGGFSSISMLIVIALFSAVYFLGITQQPYKARVDAVQEGATMYIMLNWLKRTKAWFTSLLPFSYA